jgi:hypothetical protein
VDRWKLIAVKYHLPCAIKAGALAEFTTDNQQHTREIFMQSLSTKRIPARPSSQREQSSLEQKSKLKSRLYEDSKLDCSHCEEGGAGMRCVESDCMKISLARTSNWHEERGKETNFKVR